MAREDKDNTEPEICPECGSRLAVRNRSHDGTTVSIAVCTGYPDCTYFRWSLPESSGNPHDQSALGELGSWAIKQSLSVLRDELTSQEWQEALVSFVTPLEEDGGGGGG